LHLAFDNFSIHPSAAAAISLFLFTHIYGDKKFEREVCCRARGRKFFYHSIFVTFKCKRMKSLTRRIWWQQKKTSLNFKGKESFSSDK
jgi:hypothetical protein